jgi:hypothetical protein
MHIFQKGSQDSSVSIVTGYRLKSWVSIPCRGKRFFFSTPTGYRLESWVSIPCRGKRFFLCSIQAGSGAHPAS